MSDYARANTGGATHFTAKDALTTGDPLKKVVGLQFDDEFNAILTAVNSKSDGGDLASQAQAEAGTDNTVVMTPQSVSWWAGNGAGICFDLQNLTAPAEDTFFGYDQGAGASIAFTLGDGLATTGTVLALEHLGIQDLEDAGADKMMFWDDGGSATGWLAAGAGLSINTTDLDLDLSGLTNVDGSSLLAADTFLADVSGVPKGIQYQDLGFRYQASQTTETLAATDMNSIMHYNAAQTYSIDTDTNVPNVAIGSAIIIVVEHASAVVTITALSGVTLNSVFHPGGVTGSDAVQAGGMAVLLKTATNEWYLSGDIQDS